MVFVRKNRAAFFIFFILLVIGGCASGLKQLSIQNDNITPKLILNRSRIPSIKWVKRLSSLPKEIYAINKDEILVTTWRGEMYTINLQRKKISSARWQPYRRPEPVEMLAFDDQKNTIYFTSVNTPQLFIHDLSSAKTGNNYNLPGIYGHMILKDNHGFVPHHNNLVLEIDLKTGKTRRKTDLPSPVVYGMCQIDNSIWAITEDGCLRFFDEFMNPDTSIALILNSNPIVQWKDHKLVAGDSKGRFIFVDLEKKQRIFEKKLPAPVYSAPYLSESAVIVGLANGLILKLDLSSGSEIWRYQEDGLINLPLIGNDDLILVPYTRGRLTALNQQTGTKQWDVSFDRSLAMISAVQKGFIAVDRRNKLYVFSD